MQFLIIVMIYMLHVPFDRVLYEVSLCANTPTRGYMFSTKRHVYVVTQYLPQ